MYLFGKSSREKLDTCDQGLVRVVEKVLSWGVMDFAVIEGFRSVKRQMELFKEGKTTIEGLHKKGKHNILPSLAVDLLPFPTMLNDVNIWNDRHRFTILAGLMFAAASELKIRVRWGGDWDGDGNHADQTFHDLPHWELLNKSV